jgi:hypothetical protein
MENTNERLGSGTANDKTSITLETSQSGSLHPSCSPLVDVPDIDVGTYQKLRHLIDNFRNILIGMGENGESKTKSELVNTHNQLLTKVCEYAKASKPWIRSSNGEVSNGLLHLSDTGAVQNL